MIDNHLITPPPKLVEQWIEQGVSRPSSTDYMMWFATQAARWGADQELDACCEWLCDVDRWKTVAARMRTARRPKPPTLAEQALKALDSTATYELMGYAEPDNRLSQKDCSIIRRALERLQELENNG